MDLRDERELALDRLKRICLAGHFSIKDFRYNIPDPAHVLQLHEFDAFINLFNQFCLVLHTFRIQSALGSSCFCSQNSLQSISGHVDEASVGQAAQAVNIWLEKALS